LENVDILTLKTFEKLFTECMFNDQEFKFETKETIQILLFIRRVVDEKISTLNVQIKEEKEDEENEKSSIIKNNTENTNKSNNNNIDNNVENKNGGNKNKNKIQKGGGNKSKAFKEILDLNKNSKYMEEVKSLGGTRANRAKTEKYSPELKSTVRLYIIIIIIIFFCIFSSFTYYTFTLYIFIIEKQV
jgi:predicted RND superfamily exporter protein